MNTAVSNITKDKSFMDVLVSTGGRLVVEKTGKPSHIILSLNKFYSLLETMDILSNPEQARIIKKSLEEAKEDKVFPIDKILED